MIIMTLIFALFVNSVFAYAPSVRDQRVVSFFVENLITMVDGLGRNRARDVMQVLQRMQLREESERKTYILGEARDRLGLYYNLDRVSITLEGADEELSLVKDPDYTDITP